MESLYRTYRPQTFADMVGQKHIVATLRNALTENRVAHAYLFCGPRGTGKTTTARVLAKALLCTGAGPDGLTPDPDGTCEECLAIAAGTHPDVYELDAASRTGVDNVREEIINRVAFAPTRGRYKVYIIDEVHMLTTQAFNALLKTLEEPPAHVIFVLCTTDPQKVPETILSRCQRLEFHRITTEDITARLAYVCEHEGFTADPEALALIARHSRGGLRDALSMLEQLSVFGDGSVRLDDAQTVLGEVGSEALVRMVEQICARDVAGCFAQVADLADRGVDIAQYVRDLTSYVRDLYVASVTGTKEGVLSGGTDAARAAEEAEKAGGSDRLARMLDVLGQLETNLRTSLDQRLSLEVALTRIARPQADLTLEALAERVSLLERQIAAGGGAAAVAGVPASVPGMGAAGVPRATGPAGATGAPGAGAQRATGSAGTAGFAGGVAPAAGASSPVAGGAPSPAACTASGMPIPRPVARPAVPAPTASSSRDVPRPQGGARPEIPRPAGAPASAGSRAVAMPGSPASPAPVGSASALGAPVHDPATAQRLWGQYASRVQAANPSVGGLLRQTEGTLREGGVLAITNHGSSFVGTMLMRANNKVVLERLAAEVDGSPVQVVMDVPGGASSAAPAGAGVAASGPATPGAGGASSQVGAPVPASAASPRANVPAPVGAAPARPGAPVPASAATPQVPDTPAAGVSAAARPPIPRPVQRAPQGPAAAGVGSAGVAAGPVGQGAPVGAAEIPSTPPVSAAPERALSEDDTPAYERVPDEVYDAYVPDDDDLPPFDESDASPANVSVGDAAPAQSAPAGDAAGEGVGGSMADLAKMLSAGFGGYVKVSEDRGTN